MGAARRLVLGGAILGLFWSGLPRYGGIARAENGQSSNICDSTPCTCDLYGRLNCDCKGQGEDLILTAEGEKTLSPHTSRIVVTNCPSVILMNSSLSTMTGLRSIDFTNISNLSLMTQSFELSRRSTRARISIRDARMDVLPSFAFHGDVESISFENVIIGQLNAFAFANLADTDTLRLDNCRIEKIEEQAFKKFDVNYLHIIGGSFGSEVPSRTMNDIEVRTTFVLDGVSMGIVRSSAFVIKRPKTVAIQNCIIDSIEAEAFDITARGAVIIKNNNFGNLATGAFLGIRADTEDRSFPISGSGRTSLPDMTFTNNSIVTFEEGSIMFDRGSFRPVLENIFVNRSCDCSLLAIWKNNVLNYTNLYTRFYTSQNGPLSSSVSSTEAEPIEEGPDTFLCADESLENTATTFIDYEMRNCALGSSIMLFALLLVLLIVFLATITAIVVWCCKKQRNNDEKRWISVPTNAPDVVTSKKNGVIGRDSSGATNAPVDSRITMVVPDGRLYRETEFHVIVEKAEPLTTEL